MPMSYQKENMLLNLIHCVQFFDIAGVLGISGYKMLSKTMPVSRNSSMVMGVAAKGLIIMAYMIYTEKTHNLKKFSSIKANFILSITEIVFWAAAAVLPIMNISQCQSGVGCWLTYALIGLAINNAILALPVAYITYRHWQFWKRTGCMPGNIKAEQINDDYNMVEQGSNKSPRPSNVNNPSYYQQNSPVNYDPTTYIGAPQNISHNDSNIQPAYNANAQNHHYIPQSRRQ